MNSVLMRLLPTLLALFAATTMAQGVYVTRGENGPVFSDKPQAGAKEVKLKPLNVIPPVRDKAQAGKAAERKGEQAGEGREADAALVPYRDFAVVSPQHNGSVAINSPVFEVRLKVDPPLQIGEGHAFVVRINGRPVERRFTDTACEIPPEFWEGGAPPADQSMQLDASIVDRDGQELRRADPVLFHTRFVALRRPLHPMPPGVRPPRPERPPLQPRKELPPPETKHILPGKKKGEEAAAVK